MAGYVVKSLMVLVNCENGTTVPVMQDGPVPIDVTPDHLEHLLGLGLVVEAEFEGGIMATYTAAGDLYDGQIQRPAQSDSKDAWVEYAVSRGVAADVAGATPKADLIAQFKD